MRMIEYKN